MNAPLPADERVPCAECGMPVRPREYHPFAACLMFKQCHNSETVTANLSAVWGKGYDDGWEDAKLRYAKEETP